MGLGIIAGFQASLRLACRRKISVQLIEELFWWVVIGGIAGARIYHVIDKWQEIYRLNPLGILYIWNGGLGIWGALAGGVIGLLSYWVIKLKKKVPFVGLLDIVLFGVPLGQAIGRWGNFFNNEIVGKNGEPLFLYESVLDLVLFGVLVKVSRMGQLGRIGHITGVYLIGYGLIRLILEPMRHEAIVWRIVESPVASLFSLVAIMTGLVIYSRRRA